MFFSLNFRVSSLESQSLNSVNVQSHSVHTLTEVLVVDHLTKDSLNSKACPPTRFGKQKMFGNKTREVGSLQELADCIQCLIRVYVPNDRESLLEMLNNY